MIRTKTLFAIVKFPITFLLMVGMLLSSAAPLCKAAVLGDDVYTALSHTKHVHSLKHTEVGFLYAELLEVEVDDENDEHFFQLNYTQTQVRLMAKHDGYSCNQLLLTVNKKCRSAVTLPLYVWHQAWKNFPDLV